MLEACEAATDKSGRVLSELFATLPSKKSYSDYYKLIKEPIAIDTIRARVDQGHYTTLDEFLSDCDVMFANAQQYNAPRSQPWSDAKTLKSLPPIVFVDLEMCNFNFTGCRSVCVRACVETPDTWM